MKKKFHLLENKDSANMLRQLEDFSEKGWHLESFNITEETGKPTFYALISISGETLEENKALTAELEELSVSPSPAKEQGKYQQ